MQQPDDANNESWDISNEVLDEGDQAALHQMNENQQALAKIQAKLAPESHPDFDGEHCIDCDKEIPEARLAMGRIRCVYCQEILENRSKLYAGKES